MSTHNDVLTQDAARPRTLAEKVWDDHLVVKGEDGQPDLIYIDLHLVHEVTSPQAFDGLRTAGRPLRRVDLTITPGISAVTEVLRVVLEEMQVEKAMIATEAMERNGGQVPTWCQLP